MVSVRWTVIQNFKLKSMFMPWVLALLIENIIGPNSFGIIGRIILLMGWYLKRLTFSSDYLSLRQPYCWSMKDNLLLVLELIYASNKELMCWNGWWRANYFLRRAPPEKQWGVNKVIISRIFFWESYEQKAITLIFHSSEFFQFFQIKF